MRRLAWLGLFLLLGCGDDPDPDAGTDAGALECVGDFQAGDEGHADPLGVGPGEARAGRVTAAQLPDFPSGLQVWEGGDFVLANEHVAMVIEDVGDSELYDPWGGRPVGIGRPEGGAIVEPGDFGEILVLWGRNSVLTQRVTVLEDGGEGGAAVIRAEGVFRPLPFFENIVGQILPGDFSAFRGAIDYVLMPGARHVDVYLEMRTDRQPERAQTTMHAFMHTPRMPPFAPGVGFETSNETVPWVGFADPDGTSFGYMTPQGSLGGGLEISGFVSFFTRGYLGRACEGTRVHHARIVIGGPGAGGLVAAMLETQEVATREVTGTVRDASGDAVAQAWVLAEDTDGFVSRTRTAEDGSYGLTLPASGEERLHAFRRGDIPSPPVAASEPTVDLTFGDGGWVHVTATATDGGALPARVQLLPASGGVNQPEESFGIPRIEGQRIQVAYPVDGDVTLRAPAGSVRVVVSRGFEYEIVDQTVDVTEGATVEVPVMLERVVDTTGVQCGDFHIHTSRSNDSVDDGIVKLASALADGVELPVRSDHEYPGSFAAEIAALGAEAWAYPVPSIEMTSFEAWGHMGVVPLEPQPDEVNAGAPRWQTYPTAESPNQPIVTRTAPQVFDMVRARSGNPVVIINHPRGNPNYFDYVGYDPVTGTIGRPDEWDETFTLVEVFNDTSWPEAFSVHVADWLSFLSAGRRVFAVGSSDSHRLSNSPVGYPRTCLRLGTDDPMLLTNAAVRDALAAGHGTISGGVFVDAWVGATEPGDDATGLGMQTDVRVRVQAASWVDVRSLDVVVDGVRVDTLPITPADADPLNPVIRFDQTITIDVGASNSYVIVAAFGDLTLEPVHRRRRPFGVTQPIFLSR